MPTEEEAIENFTEIMENMAEEDDWDLPVSLLVAWQPDLKGIILVLPTSDPRPFLHMLIGAGHEVAVAGLRTSGEVPEDTEIQAVALINEGWGIEVSELPEPLASSVRSGATRIASLPGRKESRLLTIVSQSQKIWHGIQPRGGEFEWIVEGVEAKDAKIGGNIPELLYTVVTGESLSSVRDVEVSLDDDL